MFVSARYGESVAVTGDQAVVEMSKETERWWLRQSTAYLGHTNVDEAEGRVTETIIHAVSPHLRE